MWETRHAAPCIIHLWCVHEQYLSCWTLLAIESRTITLSVYLLAAIFIPFDEYVFCCCSLFSFSLFVIQFFVVRYSVFRVTQVGRRRCQSHRHLISNWLASHHSLPHHYRFVGSDTAHTLGVTTAIVIILLAVTRLTLLVSPPPSSPSRW